jgi:hypothetical protein|nr:discoidin domain-containing protein [Bacteroidales bacterium]
LRSFNDNIEYSNDEGRNWTKSLGTDFQITGESGCIANSINGDRAVVLAEIDGANKVAISYDGINYTTANLSINKTTYATSLLKPLNSNNVYVVARNKTTNLPTIYRMLPSSSTFEELYTSSTPTAWFTRLLGTYVDGIYHFYHISGNDIFYSKDEGKSWTKIEAVNFGDTNGNCNVRTVHPSQPNILFRGYLDTYMSTDKGASFGDWGHQLGWDTHHMRMHQRKDGTYLHLIGNDFGIYISSSPEEKNSYFELNHLAPIQMAYDMDVSDNFNTGFTALQDRGTRSFINSDAPYSDEIRSTDGLRVTLANNEKSVWTLMYFGTVYYQANFGFQAGDKTTVNVAGNWVGASMVASPDPDEDAVIVAVDGASKLKKLKYNASSKTISTTELPVDFMALTGQSVSASGSSPLNKDIWYAIVKDGTFLYSLDAGATYTKSSSAKLARGNDQGYNYNRNQQVIKGSKLDEKTVYVAGVNNAFYISKNNGVTFTNYASGLDVYRIRDFDLSEDEKFIFAACGSAGAWVYSVEDNKWFKMDGANVPYIDFTAVNYTPSKNMVQFGTYGYGVLDFKFLQAENTPSSPQNFLAEAISSSKIYLVWDASPSDIDGYILRRSTNLITFEDVDTVGAQHLVYTDTLLYPTSDYYYRLVAYKGENRSLPTPLQSVKTPEISALNTSEWRLMYASSTLVGNEGVFAFDNDNTTKWTSTDTLDYPHEIQIDLGSVQDLQAFNYLGARGGVASSYELYFTKDSTHWGDPIAKGIWETTRETSKTTDFNKTKGRFVRFVVLDGFKEATKVSVVELTLWPDFDTRLEAPVGLSYSALSTSSIKLSWTNVAANATGCIIERLGTEGFEEIARVGATTTSYSDNGLEPYTKYVYRVKAYRSDNESESSQFIEAVSLNTGLIDPSGWQIIYGDSKEWGHRASSAIDGDESTWWLSQVTPSVIEMPHEIQIDMGSSQSLVAFSYLPRIDSVDDGTIKAFEFYISDDELNWGEPVASGNWLERKRQNVGFPKTSGRYIRLLAKSEINGKAMTNVAELMVWSQYDGITALPVISDNKVLIYPLPFTDELHVRLENLSDYERVMLISTNGRVLQSQKINTEIINIKLPATLKSGVYFLKIEGANQSIMRKVIKN